MEMGNFGNKKPRVSFSRDFPPGCGISSSSQVSFSALRSVHRHYTREFPPGCGPNAAKTPKICPEKKLRREKISGSFNDASNWRRSVTAVKKKPPLSDKTVIKPPQKLMAMEPVVVSRERKKVLEMLGLFRKRCEEITRSGKKTTHRVDVQANNELKNEGKITHQISKMIGCIPGVEVGDKFYYRFELMMVGLHRLTQGGIDQMEFGRVGGKIATCIVANERHLDKMNDPNILTYIGEGGNPKKNETVAPDQELKKGNRALWNSMKEKQPVRVVRGLKFEDQKILYVYDGLYEVRDCEKKTGPQGNMIFEFLMVRCPGQPMVNWREYRWNR